MLLAEFFAPRQGISTGAVDAYSNMGKFSGLDRGPERWTGAVKGEWTPSLGGYHRDFIVFLRNSGRLFRERCRPLVRGTPLEKMTENDAQ